MLFRDDRSEVFDPKDQIQPFLGQIQIGAYRLKWAVQALKPVNYASF